MENRKVDSMNTEKLVLKSIDFTPLKTMLEKETGDTFTINEAAFGGLWFTGSNSENELYLKSHFGKTLVISRISFVKQRSGIGTKVLAFLLAYAQQHQAYAILIESTLTSEMNQFAKKHAFLPVEHQGMWMDGEFFGNYLYMLDEKGEQTDGTITNK